MAQDFTADIAALEKAIASGATEVRYTDHTVKYDSLDNMIRRLDWMKRQQGGAPVDRGVRYAAFNRGERA